MESPKHLPKAIFCFLDLNEINIVMREDEPKLYIYHFRHPLGKVRRARANVQGKRQQRDINALLDS